MINVAVVLARVGNMRDYEFTREFTGVHYGGVTGVYTEPLFI